MGKQGAETLHKAVVIAIHRHVEMARQVVLQLHRVRHCFAVLADIGQGAREQVGI